MIYCYLKGGLGNMLFQIAATKSMAFDLNTECSFPNLDSHLKFLNDDKTHNQKIDYAFEYKSLLINLISDSPNKSLPIYNFPFHYIDSKIKDESIVDGFFQSEKYFNHNRKSILDFLNFKEISEMVNEKYSKLLTNNLTSIHIRRGDYLKLSNYHPVQNLDYYNSAIDLVINKTDNFIIFSDDIDWCKKNFKLDKTIYIDCEKDYIELYLMSLCKNNIIANSSFSWWGAWLNNNPNKIVIGPKNWFGSSIQHNSNDILPKSWIKI
jgi:hypothetical protein